MDDDDEAGWESMSEENISDEDPNENAESGNANQEGGDIEMK